MKKAPMTERRYIPASSVKGLLGNLRAHGDKILYQYYSDPTCRNIGTMTYAEFCDMTEHIAAGLSAMGMKERKIAILGETSPMWVASYLGVIASGNAAIPLDRELNVSDMFGLLDFGEADAIIYSKAYSEKVAPYVGKSDTLKTFISMEREPGTEGDGTPDMAEIISRGKENTSYVYPETDVSRMAEMLFTSGTTGTSKCVMLSEKNIISAVNSACDSVEFFPEDTIVSVLPIHHTYELCCMLAGMNYGMTVGINDSLKHVLKSFSVYRPTGLVLVPLFVDTMYKRIWETAEKQGRAKTLRFALKLSAFLRHLGIDIRKKLFSQITGAFGGRLERIVCGGAPLNPETARKFEEFGIKIMEGYGITECSPLISVNPYYRLKSGSVGPAVNSCEVRIDDASKNDAGHDEGEICVKGSNVMMGYYKNDAENARSFTEDGWYRTGDIGYLDSDGYIYITGRKKSVIVLENGKNVFPEEIEEHLSAVSGVAESVVVGRKKDDGTITLTAIIYPDPECYASVSDEEVTAELKAAVNQMNKKLATFKHVKAVEIRREPFEKTTSRKIKRHLVK